MVRKLQHLFERFLNLFPGGSITDKFLSIWGGKWYRYGHFSMTIMLASHITIFLVASCSWHALWAMFVAGPTAWLLMLGLEGAQRFRKGGTGFNNKDIWENTRALIYWSLFTSFLYLLQVWQNLMSTV